MTATVSKKTGFTIVPDGEASAACLTATVSKITRFTALHDCKGLLLASPPTMGAFALLLLHSGAYEAHYSCSPDKLVTQPASLV